MRPRTALTTLAAAALLTVGTPSLAAPDLAGAFRGSPAVASTATAARPNALRAAASALAPVRQFQGRAAPALRPARLADGLRQMLDSIRRLREHREAIGAGGPRG
ncbi:MAG TPA: hypothetical protein VNT60_05780 [Deinococcales bacterium]|nr:hypothetical protein [Deinococcales bacterium]